MSSHYHISVPRELKPLLEDLAIAHGCQFRGGPSVPVLLGKIADGSIGLFPTEISFYERLILEIANGLSTNNMATDYSPSHFGRIVRDRANAIFCESDNDSVHSED